MGYPRIKDLKDMVDFAYEVYCFFSDPAELFWLHLKDMDPKAGEKWIKELKDVFKGDIL